MGECVGPDRRSTKLWPPPLDDVRHGGLAKREALAFNKKDIRVVPMAERSMKMKTKVVLAIVALSYAPLGVEEIRRNTPMKKWRSL